MAAPTFNKNNLNSLTGLSFVNGGFGGLLSTTGNVWKCIVRSPGIKESRFEAPSGPMSAARTHGLKVRPVIWKLQLKADNDTNLNAVEALIEAYFADGGTYLLEDGKGRSSVFARMLGEPSTKRIGDREAMLNGARLQRWEIAFEVLKPAVGGASL